MTSGNPTSTYSDIAAAASKIHNDTGTLDDAKDFISMVNLIGCPLLLTCMCVERYLAVVKPVLYLRLRRWEYRMAVSAVVWVITLIFSVTTGRYIFFKCEGSTRQVPAVAAGTIWYMEDLNQLSNEDYR